MQKILIIGAGRSSTSLIEYLARHSAGEGWELTVADQQLSLAQEKCSGTNARPVAFDVNDPVLRNSLMRDADIVVSMLPAAMHMDVAQDCISLKKTLVTASYVSSQMSALDEAARDAGVLLLNECGLDPGLDHMSAMKIIDMARAQGLHVSGFSSWCGGLVAPFSDNNPWKYKFTWNPRNVVLAGQAGATFLEKSVVTDLPYERLFAEPRPVKVIHDGAEDLFEGYPNRDSLSYIRPYGLNEIRTMLRGTLRRPGFCDAWNVLVKLKLTDDTRTILARRWKDLMEELHPGLHDLPALAAQFGIPMNDKRMDRIAWLGLFTDQEIAVHADTPAKALQHLLEQKWKLEDNDRDMIVMQHEFLLSDGFDDKHVTSTLVSEGIDSVHTAMARTVGLPLAICVRLILNKKISLTGVQIPVHRQIYEPVLQMLSEEGIVFTESES